MQEQRHQKSSEPAAESYTSDYDPPILQLPPSGKGKDLLLRLLSAFLFGIAVLFWMSILPAILPLYFIYAIRARTNISLHEGGSASAIKALWGRALGFVCGFNVDPLASELLPLVAAIPGIPGGWFVIDVWTRLFVLQWRLTGTLITEQLSWMVGFKLSEVSIVHVRTSFLDAMVHAFRKQHPNGQLVVLGAGYDTRCWRFSEGFEVDAPGTQACKVKAVSQAGWDPSKAQFIAVDFSSERWLDKLTAAGFRLDLPACFVWEGVTMYLQRMAVQDTLRDIAKCAPGSVVGFDYINRQVLSQLQGATKWFGEGIYCGIDEDEMGAFIEDCGLHLLEHARPSSLQARFGPRRGQEFLLHLGDFGGLVIAQV